MHKYSVGIAGASGYSGIELCRVLAAHPAVEVRFVASDRWEGVTVRSRTGIGGAVGALSYVPNARALNAARDCVAVLLATPAEASMELAPALLERGVKVVDLSGAFRLVRRGGVPEALRLRAPRRRAPRQPRSTGCRSSSTAPPSPPLAWWPTPAVTRPPWPWPWCRCSGPGSSRTSPSSSTRLAASRAPAGKASEDYSFCEVAEDVRPYKVLRHQHTPEIAQSLARGAGKSVRLTFTPHLLPIRRGILATASVRLVSGIDRRAPAEALRAAYRDEPLVEVLDGPEQVSIARTVVNAASRVAVSTADVAARPGARSWWSRPSTTWSRAPRARRCRT